MRPIDADELIKEFDIIASKSATDNLQTIPIKHIKQIIDNAPTVEERLQGEWIDYNNTFYKCPDCGYLLEKCCPVCQTKIILPICHCRADMGGEEA